MKNILALFCLLSFFGFGQKTARSELLIPPKQVVQIDYPLYEGFNLKIWNLSKYEIGLTARDKQTDTVRKSFDLEKGSSTRFEVSKGMYLQFENRFLATVKVAFTLQQGRGGAIKKTSPITPQRAFYLENNTAQSLPLHIPGVMNPTLTPFSRSGVDLPNGQKIFAHVNGKRILILTVTDSIPHGARIDVATLIEKALNQPYKK